MNASVVGTEIRLRPHGIARFLPAGFLAFWLCGWAAAEGFVLVMIGRGVYSLFTGAPFGTDGKPVELGPGIGIGLFILFWITFWTLGGIMALRQLLLLVWSEDRLVVERDGLVRYRQLGPFRSTRRYPRETVRGICLRNPGEVLTVITDRESVRLSELGTPRERSDAVELLRAQLQLPIEGVVTAGNVALPKGWEEITDARGDRLLVQDVQGRRKMALIVTGLALVLWTGSLLLVRASLEAPNIWAVTAMTTAVALAVGWLALWLHWGRKEWRIERGRLVLQRRFRGEVTALAEAAALELVESTDSDGDRWYRLNAIVAATHNYALRERAKPAGRLLKITHAIHDPTEPRGIGLWLANRAGIPFDDKVPTPANREAEIAELRDKLASSGKLGRFIEGLIDRVQRSKDERALPRQ